MHHVLQGMPALLPLRTQLWLQRRINHENRDLYNLVAEIAGKGAAVEFVSERLKRGEDRPYEAENVLGLE